LYGYVLQNPVNWADPTGLVINDETSGRIPSEVRDMSIYRALDHLPNPVTIQIDYSLSTALGITDYSANGSQVIRINPRLHSDRADLLETYIHELNHADLNNVFGGRTPEWLDTGAVLPVTRTRNVGPGGPNAGQCPR
jgi:hypothetical protein